MRTSYLIVMVVVIVTVLLSIVLATFCYLMYPWVILYLGLQRLPNPPIPEVQYGEFPFRLEYEIDGEKVIVEDVIICEYDGIGANEGIGKFRKWKKRLSNSDEENVMLLSVNNKLKIYYSVGRADYYMGDWKENITKHYSFNTVYGEEPGRVFSISEEKLLDEYGIKLISWDFTEPIKNNFIENDK